MSCYAKARTVNPKRHCNSVANQPYGETLSKNVPRLRFGLVCAQPARPSIAPVNNPH